jgi:hypothetical protein
MLGPGTYVAENPAVSGRGGAYDRVFTRRNLGQQDTTPQQEYILNELGRGSSDLDILKGLAQRGGTDFEQAQAMLDRVKAAKAHIYELDIAADPQHFLDWDKPLSEQPEMFNRLVKSTGKTEEELLALDQSFGDLSQKVLDAKTGTPEYDALLAQWDAVRKDPHRRIGEMIAESRKPRHWSNPKEKAGEWLVNYLGRNDTAAQAMQEAGIPGIRFLDQGSRGTGAGTSNYVVFPGNEHLISILKKYGLPISAAGLAALSRLHPEEAQAAQRKPLRIELNAGERDRYMKGKR